MGDFWAPELHKWPGTSCNSGFSVQADKAHAANAATKAGPHGAAWTEDYQPCNREVMEALQGSRNYMVQNEPELHGFRKVVVVGSRRFSIRSFKKKNTLVRKSY